MSNWLNEFLYILALSKRTQWAIILGIVFFIGIYFLGLHVLDSFELVGPAKEVQDVIIHKLAKRYDKAALIALISFWIVAYKCYQKDKKRFW